ncbi:hypothetical protein A8A54_19335 [Brucella pseudogrignonensis]|uniref:hypothetical protein n=1 Tax=Brucella pseudogrignonensis TaxID=419475 RepID=UPI0007DA5FFC|nr:hypothetical protein [Brucella pseudogrignonensis]ANG98756.1 hypothetical protein A8A54_19335 [Brucella pseudogrignonensis]
MHTIAIVICGFVLLGLFVAFGWLWHIEAVPSASMIHLFIGAWIVISIVNLWIGVTTAGYPLTEELFILPQVALPPIAAAIFVRLAF